MRGDFRQFSSKNAQMLDHFFPLFFSKDSKSLKILGIRLQEVGGKKTFKRYLKSEQTHRHTNPQTHRQTDRHVDFEKNYCFLFDIGNKHLFDKLIVPQFKMLSKFSVTIKSRGVRKIPDYLG